MKVTNFVKGAYLAFGLMFGTASAINLTEDTVEVVQGIQNDGQHPKHEKNTLNTIIDSAICLGSFALARSEKKSQAKTQSTSTVHVQRLIPLAVIDKLEVPECFSRYFRKQPSVINELFSRNSNKLTDLLKKKLSAYSNDYESIESLKFYMHNGELMASISVIFDSKPNNSTTEKIMDMLVELFTEKVLRATEFNSNNPKYGFPDSFMAAIDIQLKENGIVG